MLNKLEELNLLTIGSEDEVSQKAVTIFYLKEEDYVSIVGFNFKDIVSLSKIAKNMIEFDKERYKGIEGRKTIFVQNINTKKIYDEESGLQHTEIGDSIEVYFESWEEFKENIKLNLEVS